MLLSVLRWGMTMLLGSRYTRIWSTMAVACQRDTGGILLRLWVLLWRREGICFSLIDAERSELGWH